MESYQVELWRAEAVKNWAAALVDITRLDLQLDAVSAAQINAIQIRITQKIEALLDITDG